MHVFVAVNSSSSGGKDKTSKSKSGDQSADKPTAEKEHGKNNKLFTERNHIRQLYILHNL